MRPKLRPFIDLLKVFDEINHKNFEGILQQPLLGWNSRLRSSAGRFRPGAWDVWEAIKMDDTWDWDWSSVYETDMPLIEVASYLLEEKNAEELVRDTMAHEMIHFWLWDQYLPYGHTAEFLKKMREMGVSRYNPVPRSRPFKYRYECRNCARPFMRRRKMTQRRACLECCTRFNAGEFHSAYLLILVQTF